MSYGQKLKFKVKNQKDTTVHLIKYFGTKKFYADTAEMKNGIVEFDGRKQASGILGLLMPGQRYFEFIYNNEDIDLETEGPDYAGNLIVNKSEENNVFIPYIRFIGSQKSKMNKLGQERASLQKTDSRYDELTKEIKSVNAGVQAYQENIIAENDGMLVAKIV